MLDIVPSKRKKNILHMQNGNFFEYGVWMYRQFKVIVL